MSRTSAEIPWSRCSQDAWRASRCGRATWAEVDQLLGQSQLVDSTRNSFTGSSKSLTDRDTRDKDSVRRLVIGIGNYMIIEGISE